MGRDLPRIGVTLGCPCGVGPQVVAQALSDEKLRTAARWVIYGAPEAWRRAGGPLGLKAPLIRALDVATTTAPLSLVPSAPPDERFTPGHPTARADRASARALTDALHAAQAGWIHAVATGPARKASFSRIPGGPWPGHTELFHARLGVSPAPVMLFVASGMRLALHTIHLPLSRVPAAVTVPGLLTTLRTLTGGLRDQLGVKTPSVHVLGLNPHASEGGRIGREDVDVVAPAVAAARAEVLDVEGPFPADGYFARYRERTPPGAVLALYHDQGLGPFKLWERGRGCQMTVGLSVPRASCDHGTAYDVAGTDRVDARSMAAALKLALRLANREREVQG
ncbi:MAG: 4-hydroxythreonine-4-phosphate dehydrogenase PdxA [Myxococcota bacterium]